MLKTSGGKRLQTPARRQLIAWQFTASTSTMRRDAISSRQRSRQRQGWKASISTCSMRATWSPAQRRRQRQRLADAQSVTHLGYGAGKVEKVASNRRILGPSGKVEFQRMSSSVNKAMQGMPEGTIDPLARVVSFLVQGDKPLAVLTYYTTHPQSFYRTGKTKADFVGMGARRSRGGKLPGTRHVHFNGLQRQRVVAGKYNDGSA